MAQSFSIGLKGGVNLTKDLQGSATSESKRYVAGPMATVRLPLGLHLEFNALYRHVGYRTSFGNILGESSTSRFTGNSWEFPIMVRKELWHGIFASGGYAPRVINGSGHVNSIHLANPFDQITKRYDEYDVQANWNTTSGIVATGGIEKRVGPLRIAPEIRYTRWRQRSLWQFGPGGYSITSTQNQLDLLVGIRFP